MYIFVDKKLNFSKFYKETKTIFETKKFLYFNSKDIIFYK